MTNRSLALLASALLACGAAQGAPKKKPSAPPAEAASTAVDPQALDLDAMARAKDGKPTEPLDAQASGAAPAAEAAATAEPEPAAAAAQPSEAATADAPIDTAADATAESTLPAEAAPASAAASEAPSEAPAQTPPVVAEEAPAADAPATLEVPTTKAGDAPTEAAGNTAPEAAKAGATEPVRSDHLSPLASQSAPNEVDKRLAAGCEARATALLDAAQKGDYAAATRDFDAKMRSALPPAQFRKAWESLSQFGALQARGQAHPMMSAGYIAITIPLIFDKANLYAQVACGSDGRVAGFYVKPL